MQENFWLSFAAIASTLSGFTLASYSIYTNRAEVVASDSMCRNYALKEATSRESLKFIFLTLAMFLVPLLVSFGFLVNGGALYLVLGLACAFIVFLIPFGVWATFSTIRYQFRVTSCEEKVKQLGQSAWRVKSWSKALALLPLLVAPLLAALWSLSLLVVHIASEDALWGLASWALSSYSVEERAMIACLFAVIGGTGLVYVHFRIFDPVTLLFAVGAGAKSTLARTTEDLNDKCEALEKSKRILVSMIRNLDRSSKDRIMKEFHLERAEVDKHLEEVKNFAEGWHRDSEGHLVRLFDQKSYHAERLEFCRKESFLSYDQWVRIISDVEQYLQGLRSFEAGLQERRRDYLEVIRSRGAIAPGFKWANLFNTLVGFASAYFNQSKIGVRG